MLVEGMAIAWVSLRRWVSNPSNWANHRWARLVACVHWFLPKDWQPDQNILKPAIFCRMLVSEIDHAEHPNRYSVVALHRSSRIGALGALGALRASGARRESLSNDECLGCSYLQFWATGLSQRCIVYDIIYIYILYGSALPPWSRSCMYAVGYKWSM